MSQSQQSQDEVITVRRVLEYRGPRRWVEDCLKNSVIRPTLSGVMEAAIDADPELRAFSGPRGTPLTEITEVSCEEVNAEERGPTCRE